MTSIQESLFGRMSQEHSLQTKGETSVPSSTKWDKQGRVSANGRFWMRNTSESPNGAEECSSSLSLILQPQQDVPTHYYLSAKACEGILRRADRRNKILPPRLKTALKAVLSECADGDDPVSPTLVARGPHAVAHIGPSYVLRERAGKPGGGKGPLVSEEKTLAIKTVNDLSLFTPAMRVRRLTPIECERLMGWPDDWTSGQADTHRYKQCGNGVAAPVATWIGEQLMKLDA